MSDRDGIPFGLTESPFVASPFVSGPYVQNDNEISNILVAKYYMDPLGDPYVDNGIDVYTYP